MPTFLRIRGFRFYAYALEGNEPAHVHIDRGSGSMKVWLGDLSGRISVSGQRVGVCRGTGILPVCGMGILPM